MEKLYHFSGAGNDFVVLDGRGKDIASYQETSLIQALCKQFGTDGLMILREKPGYDFSMAFYNPDGSGGMMCGNGGRCIVAFADMLGLAPSHPGLFRFLAPDGPHAARILSRSPEGWVVRLEMIDVQGVLPVKEGYFLNTGTRHFVQFVADVEQVDVEQEGRRLRWDPAFAPEGTNVNFVHIGPDGSLHVRTFEKGVEGETLACGTGITASAIAAAFSHRVQPSGAQFSIPVHARQDDLSVDFRPYGSGFTEVFLTGPACLVAVRDFSGQ